MCQVPANPAHGAAKVCAAEFGCLNPLRNQRFFNSTTFFRFSLKFFSLSLALTIISRGINWFITASVYDSALGHCFAGHKKIQQIYKHVNHTAKTNKSNNKTLTPQLLSFYVPLFCYFTFFCIDYRFLALQLHRISHELATLVAPRWESWNSSSV